MTILSAQSIRKRAAPKPSGWGGEWPTQMIQPFTERDVSPSGMSYGLSSAGYDVRIAQGFTLMPGECRLASTIERFDIPHDLMPEIKDKSTWARRFLTLQNTTAEPGWRGHLTLELINHSPLAIDIAAGDPIAQIIFHRLDYPTEQPYIGKYQDQIAEPVPSRRETFDAYGDRLDWDGQAQYDETAYRELTRTAPSHFRIVHPQVVEDDDPEITIYIGNKQIGYVLQDRLFLIGADNRATEVCDVTDEGLLPGLLAQHYRAI